MKHIVIGCGRLGSDLAYRLFMRGDTVCVVDQKETAFENLPDDFRGRTLEGDALSRIVLRRAGIENADGVAVVTTSDTINAVIGHVAQNFYLVPRVVVRNYAPRYQVLHEAFQLQMISSSTWGAQRMEELLYNQELRTVFSAGNGEVEIYEFTIPHTWDSKSINDLLPPEGCHVTALTRAGRALLPKMDLILQQGDILLMGATLEGAEAMRNQLTNTQREV